ncbi:amidohydrolase family protein [Cellulophaga sp. E16_2]|uniref:amidohydrolase family protein n=1 Tax=unclassified Cellulophaga TaxID=2634405 RepID=UPI0013FE2370|nr:MULTISPECIES: amidohydrolase family protein [unclassified Cellulophaga]MBO0590180.1 amidohydrolase family protein [Cellulophaga sp. E16_2]
MSVRPICLVISLLLGTILCFGQEDLLLKDFDPVSIYKVPVTTVQKAKFTAIDMHSHPYPNSKEEIGQWVETMDALGIEKTIILTYQTGKAFDSIYKLYSKYDDRFELWCGFDYTGYTEKGWAKKAVKELERCYNVGARGIGELGDKGEGLLYSKPTPAYGMHIDDERMKPLIQKCGELGMPINIHVAEPYWMYEPIDKHNDGLMNADTWQIDKSKKDFLLHQDLVTTLENAVKENSKTTFIACHFANCSYDLSIIGKLLETYPNLYADISARYAETAPVPRYTKAFYEKHQDKLLYGTDMGVESDMYQTTFRILETEDEHFYENSLFGYHWALNGLGLSDTVLKKIYYENAQKIID